MVNNVDALQKVGLYLSFVSSNLTNLNGCMHLCERWHIVTTRLKCLSKIMGKNLAV